MEHHKSLPDFKFTISDTATASRFSVSAPDFVEAYKATIDGVASGAFIFNRTHTAMLLIQRAATDSMPNKFEIPGGAVDDEDATILHGVARELWEEAGLVASRIGPLVPAPGKPDSVEIDGVHFFSTRRKMRIGKFSFIVEAEAEGGGDGVESRVKLDPKEHQSYVWATEEECVAGKKGHIELEFTTNAQRETILEAWKVVKGLQSASAQAQ